VTQIFKYASFPFFWGNTSIREHLRNRWHYVSVICAYESSILLGNPYIRTLLNMYHKGVVDIISRPYTHAFLPYLRVIRAYIHSKTLHHYDSHIITNSFNGILRSYLHTKWSVPLGNACITNTPNIYHLMKSIQR
jgi:hypothetical protein